MRTLAIVNQKGGSGKTTTAINLAAIYARRGLRTLLVDIDPQSHCAVGLGVPERQLERSIADALIANLDRFDFDSLLWEVNANLHLAPSTMRLATLEAPGGGLHELPDKDRRLEAVLAKLARRFDRCIIDCPPTIGLLTFNALRACRETLIPVETGFFALRGAEKQWQTIQRLIAHINRPIACHMLATLHNPHSNLARDILSALHREFAGQILPIVIEEHEALREAASFGQPIVEFAPDSDARRQFDLLADWLEDHIAAPVVNIETFPTQQAARESPSTAVGAIHAGASATRAAHAVSSAVDTRHSERAAELVRRVQSLARADGADAAARGAPPPASGSTSHSLENARDPTSRSAATIVPSISPERRVVAIEIEPRPELAQPDVSVVPHRPAPPITPRSVGSIPRAPAISIPPPREPDPIQRSIQRAIDDIRESIQPVRETTFSWPPPMPLTLPQPRADQVCELKLAPPADRSSVLFAIFGVRVTATEVVFSQPADGRSSIAVAADFNRWSPRAHVLTRVAGTNRLELRLRLPPGRYHYRLVVDGRWLADPYNAQQLPNAHGEPHSIIDVPPQRPEGTELEPMTRQ